MTAPAELLLAEQPPALRPRDPVLVVALQGFFDACGAATAAAQALLDPPHTVTIGEIDPDPFYDFTVERPSVELVDNIDGGGGGTPRRQIHWPSNEVHLVRDEQAKGDDAAARDLLVVTGVEPHLAWATYIDCLLAVVETSGCSLVVTLGAVTEATPHTRQPIVVGSTADGELARRLGLAAPSYQGVTGVIGVLHSALEARAVPSVSLRVGVPHYLPGAEHPRATASLVRHLGHVTDRRLHAERTAEQIEHWDTFHSDAVDGDDELGRYVRALEEQYDRRAESAVASGDDLAARFEELLREQPDEPDE